MNNWRMVVTSAVLGLLMLAGAVAGSEKATVMIDGKTIDADYRLESGRVVGPVAPIIRALGSKAEFKSSLRRLSVRAFSPWPSFETGVMFRTVGPFDFRHLGPVLAARQHLCGLQEASLAAASSGKPVLVRFEIVGAYSFDLAAGGRVLREQNPEPMTNVVRAVLYWADMESEFSENPLTQRQVQVDKPTGAQSWCFQGPSFKSGRVETVEYHVVSKDAQITDNLQGIDVPPGSKTIGVIYGDEGWQVEDSRVLETRQVELKDGRNYSVPLYDMTVQKLDPTRANRGVEFARSR